MVSKRLTGLLSGIGAVLLFSGTNAVAIEEPNYEVLKAYSDFELRRYDSYLVAETEVRGDFEDVGSEAFRILAGYIFGDNQAREKMEMTAPVNQRPAAAGSEKIEMTAPVAQRPKDKRDKDTFFLSFVMPSRYTLGSLPRPLDPRIQLREEPAKIIAVRRYSGAWSQANYRENESLLLKAIASAGLDPVAPPVYARYNSPFSISFMRRNEVMVEVKASEGAAR